MGAAVDDNRYLDADRSPLLLAEAASTRFDTFAAAGVPEMRRRQPS
jgi:hypothetical protein